MPDGRRSASATVTSLDDLVGAGEIDCGTVRPSALAVEVDNQLKLTRLHDRRSAGFSPLRILPA